MFLYKYDSFIVAIVHLYAYEICTCVYIGICTREREKRGRGKEKGREGGKEGVREREIQRETKTEKFILCISDV